MQKTKSVKNNNNIENINNNNISLKYKENGEEHQVQGLDLGVVSLNGLSRMQSSRLADLQSSHNNDLQSSLNVDQQADLHPILKSDLQSGLRNDLLHNLKDDHQPHLEFDLKSSFRNDPQSNIQLNGRPGHHQSNTFQPDHRSSLQSQTRHSPQDPPGKLQSTSVLSQSSQQFKIESRSWRRKERQAGPLVTIREDC